MADTWTQMNQRLKELAKLSHHSYGSIFEGYRRNDWRPFLAAAKEAQESFNSGLDVTKQERTELWNAFNALRDEARAAQNNEREDFTSQSDHIRNQILNDCGPLHFSGFDQFTNYLVDASNRASADEVKELGHKLSLAMKRLSENKQFMLTAHKQECFDKFQEIKASHDKFWEFYRGKKQELHQERDRKREAFIEKVRANIDKNREKLAKAESFLESQRARVDDIREKLSGENTSKWQDIYEGWLAEAESKVESAEEQVERIAAWIREDEEKLS